MPRSPRTDFNAPPDPSWLLSEQDEMVHWCRAWAGTHVTAGDCELCACPPCLTAKRTTIAWVRENIPERANGPQKAGSHASGAAEA